MKAWKVLLIRLDVSRKHFSFMFVGRSSILHGSSSTLYSHSPQLFLHPPHACIGRKKHWSPTQVGVRTEWQFSHTKVHLRESLFDPRGNHEFVNRSVRQREELEMDVERPERPRREEIKAEKVSRIHRHTGCVSKTEGIETNVWSVDTKASPPPPPPDVRVWFRFFSKARKRRKNKAGKEKRAESSQWILCQYICMRAGYKRERELFSPAPGALFASCKLFSTTSLVTCIRSNFYSYVKTAYVNGE